MAKEIRLPQLGQTMEEGTIVDCSVKVGDEIKKGSVIFEIETDKATLEMESPADGFVKYILAEIDETYPVGQPLMVIGEKDEDVPQSFVDSLSQAPAQAQATAAAPQQPAPAPEPAKPAARIIASPRAKKLAADLGLDLAKVTPTGPGGKITEQDIQNAAGTPKPPAAADDAPQPAPGATIPLNRLQKITAERMLQSKREIPCFYLTVKADMTDLVALRTKMNQSADPKVAYNDFIIKAVADGLEKFPVMTGQLAGETIKLADSINIGLAISVPDGLVAPILKDVGKKSVTQIAADSKVIIDKARAGKLAPTDLEGGCITVSNLGAFGIDNFIPIVVPGQCTILGIGRITDTCVPDNGGIAVRKLMNMTLSVDHKVANGAYAAQFLDFVRKQLEDTAAFES
ncbi:MAG: 2-oxo acid dehydrogenase subunit E2 [Sedimentisphaerales bacterium]|nr:2-oxo acid dehydrogenase subunit E2 [Sedimentisphaerales bacterium]